MKGNEEKRLVTVKSSNGFTFQAEWDGSFAECRECGEEIGFAQTKKGKWIPFDPPENNSDPVEPHWATCPNAKDVKK